MTPEEFLNAVIPGAQATMKAYGVPASITLAQAILESSWGKSALTVNDNNLFGIKADKSWTGNTADYPTDEFINGVRKTVIAKWRKYNNWNESVMDHGYFLKVNQRYKNCFLTSDPLTFVTNMKVAGYSTDPDYIQKIMAIIKGRNLTQYDKI